MQTVTSPSTGLSRRTSKGREWLVIVQQDEAAAAEAFIFDTEEKAQRSCRAIGDKFAPLVHYVEKGILE